MLEGYRRQHGELWASLCIYRSFWVCEPVGESHDEMMSSKSFSQSQAVLEGLINLS